MVVFLLVVLTSCYRSKVEASSTSWMSGFASTSTNQVHNVARCLDVSTLATCSDAVVLSASPSFPRKRAISHCGPSAGSANHYFQQAPLTTCCLVYSENYLALYSSLACSIEQRALPARHTSIEGPRLSGCEPTSSLTVPSIWVAAPSPLGALTWETPSKVAC